MSPMLEFEKPIFNLKDKIEELKSISQDSEIDLTDEIATLEQRLASLEDDIYSNLNPWNRVQIARHQSRPTTLDYIYYVFDVFLDFHGDRYYGDDPAVVRASSMYRSQAITSTAHRRGQKTRDNIDRNLRRTHAALYRQANRHLTHAEKLTRPLATFIATKGAQRKKAAEARGEREANS